MNQTNPKIIGIVVGTIAIDATFGIVVLAYCLVYGITPDQVLLTSFIGLTTGLVGTLTGLLINTRSQPSPDAPPIKAEITNAPDNPANVKEAKP